MLKHNFKTAYRSFTKNPFVSISNVFVLAVIISLVLSLFSYVIYEKSYDKFHANIDNIYRIQSNVYKEGKWTNFAICASAISDYMINNVADVDKVGKFHIFSGDGTIRYGNKAFMEDRIYVADNDFLSMFSFPLIQGDQNTALSEPKTAVITETMAQKYFGKENPMGKIVSINGKYISYDCKITGVVKDIPENSHIQFDFLLSIHDWMKLPRYKSRLNPSFWTYIQLKPNANIATIEKQTTEGIRNYPIFGPLAKVNVKLQPLEDIHLFSNLEYELMEVSNGNYKIILLLSSIGMVFLLVAWFNYINMTTIRSMKRFVEMGLRKTFGARFSDNFSLFFMEAFFQISLAFIIALLIYQATFPLLGKVMHVPANFSVWEYPDFLYLLLLLFSCGILMISLSQAILLTAVKPIQILRKTFKIGQSGKINLRNSPIIAQLVLFTFLIAGTLVVIRQVNFLKNKDLGFNKDNIILVSQPHVSVNDNDIVQQMERFDFAVENDPTIDGLTRSVYYPGTDYGQYAGVWEEEENPKVHVFPCNHVRYNYLDFYKMKFLAGRNFSDNYQRNKSSIIINKSAMIGLGYKDPLEVVGKSLVFRFDDITTRVVIGVIDDFNQQTLKEAVQPMVFVPHDGVNHTTAIRYKAGKLKPAMSALKSHWEATNPGNEFVYWYLDDKFEKNYKNESEFQNWIILLSFLAIIISCTGLFAITLYAFMQRTKEICIRKVVGANIPNIILLLSRDYLSLIGFSLLIGLVGTYFIMSEWLLNYAYKITIREWFLIIPLFILLVIFLFTISLHIKKIIRINPASALRHE